MNAAGFHEVPFRAIARSRGPRALLFFRVRPKPFVSSVSFSLPPLCARDLYAKAAAAICRDYSTNICAPRSVMCFQIASGRFSCEGAPYFPSIVPAIVFHHPLGIYGILA